VALPRRYDAITCLFSAIGYALTPQRLHETLNGMAAHLEPGGVIIIDPWFEPGELTDRWISMVTGGTEDIAVCRMSRTLIEGSVSRLEFEYLIGTSAGIERRSESHSLGLFTREQMEAAFTRQGSRCRGERPSFVARATAAQTTSPTCCSPAHRRAPYGGDHTISGVS
jgi:hypothetical protein